MLFIDENLIEKTRNYSLDRNADRSEMSSHLMGLNADKTDLDKINAILDKIFDDNDGDIIIEVLVIDYDDNINVNIKDEGKGSILDEVKKEIELSDDVKYSQTLGFNNIEYVMNKAKD